MITINVESPFYGSLPYIGKRISLLIDTEKLSKKQLDLYLNLSERGSASKFNEFVFSYPPLTIHNEIDDEANDRSLGFLSKVISFGHLNDLQDHFYLLVAEIEAACLFTKLKENSSDKVCYAEVVRIFKKKRRTKEDEMYLKNMIRDTLTQLLIGASKNKDDVFSSPISLPDDDNILEYALKEAFNPEMQEFYNYLIAPTIEEEARLIQNGLISNLKDSPDVPYAKKSKKPFSELIEEELIKEYGEEAVNAIKEIDKDEKTKKDSENDDEDEDGFDFNFDSLLDDDEQAHPCFQDEDDSVSLYDNGYYQDYVKKHGRSTEMSKYVNFLNKLDASKEAKDEIAKEIYHFSHERKNTSDYSSCVNWLENVMALPWNASESADFSIESARDIIEKSHYGMKDVKERIIEMLAVRKKNGTNNGAIICLIGPPGCGKTSIAKSIAEALGKKFTRFSVGSLHDESDIVGHRRTYVASAPGKIMNAMRSAGAKDPVILIDEIDKAATRQGNPLSALLEVLDPEQNKNFQDVYFDFPYDLSKVVFILTANDMSEIPLPLLDRFDVIEVNGYSENEKVHIAKDFLLPKIMKESGLKQDEFAIEDEAIKCIINNYTMEEGVRNLERSLSKIVRKFILNEFTSTERENLVVTKDDIHKYLGVPILDNSTEIKADKPGSSLGLSKSSVGGDVLRIEVVQTKGNGALRQTGHLGDVLRESSEVAFTLLKSMYSKEEGADDFFKNNNFHLHMPEGAIKKDGPSAGSAMFSAFYSLYKNTVIKPHLAMTGEINLLGEVTPIGGLRDKLLGAKRNGVTEVIVPRGNKKDIDDLEDEVKNGLTIHTVSNINEVIKIAFPNTEKISDNDSGRTREAVC